MMTSVKPCVMHSVPGSPWGRRRQWHPTPGLLPGSSHGQRSLVGCSPWDHKELDTTEQLHFHFSLSCIGEGNGNPLQCSCLENPRDGGAWWDAVYGVTQSRTWMKQLSSSSSSSSSMQTIGKIKLMKWEWNKEMIRDCPPFPASPSSQPFSFLSFTPSFTLQNSLSVFWHRNRHRSVNSLKSPLGFYT